MDLILASITTFDTYRWRLVFTELLQKFIKFFFLFGFDILSILSILFAENKIHTHNDTGEKNERIQLLQNAYHLYILLQNLQNIDLWKGNRYSRVFIAYPHLRSLGTPYHSSSNEWCTQ